MIVQPTLDGRAETAHPPRVPRFGPLQRRVLRLLGAALDNDLAASIFTPSERRAADRLCSRGYVGRAGAIYWLVDRSDG